MNLHASVQDRVGGRKAPRPFVNVRRFTTIVGLTLPALCGGCLAPNDARLGKLPAAATQPAENAEIAQGPSPVEPANENSLATIEDFLRRTSRYRVDAATTAGATNVPASPHILPPQGVSATAPLERERKTPSNQESAASDAPVKVGDAPPAKTAMPVPALISVAVDVPAVADSQPADPPVDKTTNLALDVQGGERRSTLDDLLVDLAALAEDRKDFETHWRLRLVQLASGREEEAAAPPKGLSENPSQLLQDLILAAVAVRDAARNPLLTGERALARVENLRDTLADRADPRVTTIVFCRKVSTFGDYEEMSASDFVSGRTIQTIVYSEISNLRARRTTNDQFETRLSTRLEVFSEAGEVVWHRDEPQIVDTCRRRRTDFFLAQRVLLPATLPAGSYVLKVLVEDQLAGRATEAAHEFQIHAPISVAQGP